MKFITSVSIKKQAGITLLEIIIALAVMSVMVVGTSALIERSNADTRAAVAAQQLRTVGDAASAYIKDNYAAVMANATAATPALIRVSDLVAGGYLTTGATTINAYQQNQCILVLEPTANNFTALVVTESGTTIDDITLGGLASLIGASGGGIYSTATTTVRGAMGGWSFATGNFANANHLGQHCDGTAGVVALAAGHPAMALWFANGSITSGYLYRDSIPGQPQLNTMNTPLIMASVQAASTACTSGAIARDAAGALLSCDVGTLLWKAAGGSQYWQDPVANFAALPACDAAAINQTRVVQTPTVGTGARAYTCNGAGTWQALGVDNSGNLTVAGAISTASLTATGVVTGTGGLTTGLTAAVGAACAGTGTLAKDVAGTGLILSCQSGSWQKAQGASGPLASVVFNGMTCGATCSILRSSNVLSVSYIATGVYKINFSTPMSDTSFGVAGISGAVGYGLIESGVCVPSRTVNYVCVASYSGGYGNNNPVQILVF